MKLAGKLILLFIAVVVAITALASHFTSKQFFANLETRHANAAASVMGQQDEVGFRQAITQGDHLYFRSIAQSGWGEQMKVRWVWFEETVSAEFQPRMNDASMMSGMESKTITFSDGSTGRSLITYCPVSSGNRTGAVEIETPLQDADSTARHIWLNSMLSIAAMGLLGIGIIMTAGVRWIAKPLDELTEKMRRVGEGDLSGDLPVRSNDELGQLTMSVNQMCAKLREQKETIEKTMTQKIQAVEQLRHADRLKTVGQLAAGVAHEVGTPLNVVSGRASLILKDLKESPERIAEHVEAIKAESNRISIIVQQLLEFARRNPSQKTDRDLRDVIQHSVALLEPLAEKQRVTLSVDVPDSEAVARYDFNQIQQVIINLIDNAVDASTIGTSVGIRLFEAKSGQRWRLEITDKGPGIADESRENVFEPFFTTKPVGKGTGLGLSIVHGIVEEHGGEIDFISDSGGTSFSVELPKVASA